MKIASLLLFIFKVLIKYFVFSAKAWESTFTDTKIFSTEAMTTTQGLICQQIEVYGVIHDCIDCILQAWEFYIRFFHLHETGQEAISICAFLIVKLRPSILTRKGHANVLQPEQLKFSYFCAPPPVSNPLLALTLMVSDHFAAEITPSTEEMLIFN